MSRLFFMLCPNTSTYTHQKNVLHWKAHVFITYPLQQHRENSLWHLILKSCWTRVVEGKKQWSHKFNLSQNKEEMMQTLTRKVFLAIFKIPFEQTGTMLNKLNPIFGKWRRKKILCPYTVCYRNKFVTLWKQLNICIYINFIKNCFFFSFFNFKSDWTFLPLVKVTKMINFH